jgi:peptidase M23-like protein
MRARCYIAVAVLALVFVATSAAKSGVPQIVFPVVGPVTYQDDFGDARGSSRHDGNDLMAAKRSPAVAAEGGTVKYWTTSANAGCMLYLYGDSGTTYLYIHLNNDLTLKNDNKGKCVQGVSYAVPDKARVTAGQQIGFVGDSGDANGIASHLHFEVHPNGKNAVDPFPYLKKALRLLAPAPPEGRMFTLKLTGTVIEVADGELTMSVTSVFAWPSHIKQTKIAAKVTLLTDGQLFEPGEKIVAFTAPAAGTIAALTGQPGSLFLDRAA